MKRAASIASAAVFSTAGMVQADTRALVLVSDAPGAHETLAMIREAGVAVDFRPGTRGLPAPRELLAHWDVVLVPSQAGLSHSETWKIREYARLGGGVLLSSQGEWHDYAATPLEEAAPTCFGYEHPTLRPLRASSVAEHPAVSLGDWQACGVIRPQADIRPPDDPRFARPKTSELSRYHKPLYSRQWTVLVRGDDPGQTPLLTCGLYGAGRVAITSFPPEQLSGRSGAVPATRRLLTWLAGSRRILEEPAPQVLAVGGAEPALVEGMGFWIRRDAPANWAPFAAVVVGGLVDKEMAGRLVRYLQQGGTVVLLEPGVLDGPLAELGNIGRRTAASGEWPPVAWTLGGAAGEPSGQRLLPPWAGQAHITAKFGLDEALTRETVQLRWGNAENSSLVIGDIGIHSLTLNGRSVDPGEDGVCPLTGLLRRGSNTLQIWSWGDGIHPMPLPRFESGVVGRMQLPNGWLTRHSFSGPRWAPTSGEALWRWENGLPALVRTTWRDGTVYWLTASILDELVDPRSVTPGGGRASKRKLFREYTGNLPSLAVHQAIYGTQHMPRVEVQPPRKVKTWVASPEERLVWRLYNWQRSLIAQGEADGDLWIDLPEPEDATAYEATGSREQFWLEVGVLSPSSNVLLFSGERWIAPSAPARLSVLLPTVAERAAGSFVTLPRLTDLPEEWSEREVAEFPLFKPGEEIQVTLICLSATATDARLRAEVQLPLAHGTTVLLDRDVELAPGVPVAFTASTGFQVPFQPCRLEAVLIAGDRTIARTTKIFYVVEPWRGLRSVLEVRSKGMQVMGSLYDQTDGEEFAIASLLADPPRGFFWGPYAATYAGQPWCNWHPHPHGLFPNGQYYRDWLRPQIRKMASDYGAGPDYAVSASLVDGFNGVPDPKGCFFPQNLYAFSRWMAESGTPVLAATVGEFVEAVRWHHFDRWAFFVASELALRNHEIFKGHLTDLSRCSDVIDQCDLPLAHQILHVPHLEKLAPRWESVFSLSSSDAWNVQVGRGYHSPTYTQMVAKSMAPGLQLGHYHMEMLGGDGVELISLSERMRRQNYDAFWMMAVDREGVPRPLQDFFNGGGVSWLGGWRLWLRVCAGGDRGGNVDTDHDWWALTHAYALMEAVGPEQPLGGCWLVASNRFPPGGYDPGFSMGDGALLFSLLREHGVSIPVGCDVDNMRGLAKCEGAVHVPPAWLADEPVAGLRALLGRGKGLALIQTLGRGARAPSPLDGDFGLRHLGLREGTYRVSDHVLTTRDQHEQGTASSSYGTAGADVLVGLVPPREGRGGDETPRVVIGTNQVRGGRTAFWSDGILKGPFARGREIDHALARTFARAVNWALGDPVTFEEGTCGYAFAAKGMAFIVVEELTGKGRVVDVGLRTTDDGSYNCVDLNSNKSLSCRHDGDNLWIKVPLRPSGATLVVASPSS